MSYYVEAFFESEQVYTLEKWLHTILDAKCENKDFLKKSISTLTRNTM